MSEQDFVIMIYSAISDKWCETGHGKFKTAEDARACAESKIKSGTEYRICKHEIVKKADGEFEDVYQKL